MGAHAAAECLCAIPLGVALGVAARAWFSRSPALFGVWSTAAFIWALNLMSVRQP